MEAMVNQKHQLVRLKTVGMKRLKTLIKHRWANQTKNVRLVEILWVDATSVSGEEWAEWEEAAKTVPAPSLSVGYVVTETPLHITIVGLVNDNHIGHGICIPKGMIHEIRDLI
jgi:hypothetical protein